MLGRLGDKKRFKPVSATFKYLLVIAALLSIFLFQLGSRPAGLSSAEIKSRELSQNLNAILDNPVNAPHNLVTYLLNLGGLNSPFWLRLSSVLFALLFLVGFYFVCKQWFGKSIALMSSAFLVATPLFIISARQATAEIMFFSILLMMALYMWLTKGQGFKNLALLFLCILGALFLYTPGMVWWVVGSLIICRKKIIEATRDISKPVVAMALLAGLLVLVPLAIAAFKDTSILRDVAAIPAHFSKPLETLKDLGWMVMALFIKAPFHSDLILGKLPLLNFIQISLLIFGIFAMWTAARPKALILIGAVMLGVLLAGFNNNLSFLAYSLAPALIFIGTGLRYLYIEWRSIFPRNPAAKTLALMLMSGLVIVNLLYGLRYGLVAWPAAPTTKSVYMLK